MGTIRRFLRNKSRMSTMTTTKRTMQILGAMASMGMMLQPATVSAESTIERTSSSKNLVTGQVTNIYAETIHGNKYGVNKFRKFQLDANHIANMYFAKESEPNTYVNTLVNLVENRIDINGTVNAVKNGKIGGDLFFFSKDGMIVGKTGVINAGSLHVGADTGDLFEHYSASVGGQKEVEEAITADGFNAIPINDSGTITVLGKINTTDGVHLRAARIGVGKNVSGKDLDGVKADAVVSGAAIKSGIVDFTNLVNTSNAKAGLTGKLTATRAEDSGDIVLAAYNSYNDNYSILDDFTGIAGETVLAEVTVGAGSEVVAAEGAKAEITANAINNYVKDGYGNDKAVQDTNSHLFGQIVTTNANVVIDGRVEADQVTIDANAMNRYVSYARGKMDPSRYINAQQIVQNVLRTLAGATLDASYAVLESNATVNVGKDAVVIARGTDVTADGETTPALSITAETQISAGTGPSKGVFKVLGKPDDSRNEYLPSIGVSYTKTVNNATVTVDGALASGGSTKIQTDAENTISSSAEIGGNDNVADFALNITTADINSKVIIGSNAKMSGQKIDDTTNADLNGDVSMRAIAVNYLETSAEVSDSEKTSGAMALNITTFDSDADVDIAADVVSTDGNINVLANDLMMENDVSADNALGDTWLGKLEDNIITGKTAKKAGMHVMKATYAWLASKLGYSKAYKEAKSEKKEDDEDPFFTGLQKYFSAGASAAVALESNDASVTIRDGVKLQAAADLNVNANSRIVDTNISAQGATKNNDDVETVENLINVGVVYAQLDNNAKVTVEGAAAGKGARLIGKNVTVKADSRFEYNRLKMKISELVQTCDYLLMHASLPSSYKEKVQDLKNKANAYSTALGENPDYTKTDEYLQNADFWRSCRRQRA